MNGTVTTGFSPSTAKHLLLDAGAVYKNYGLPSEAIIGATTGGNEFDFKPKPRQIKVDGVKVANAKGLQVLDSIEITLKCNFLEATEEVLAMGLNADIEKDDPKNPTGYDRIIPRAGIHDSDYIDNVALVTTISGSGKPIIIILKNTLSLAGLQIKSEDSKDITLPVTFTASADPQHPQEIPCEIHYPSDVASAALFYVTSAIIDNSKVLLTMSDTVAATVPADGFTVTLDGQANVVTAAARGVNAANTILLTLTTAPASGKAVTVAYTQPTDTTKQVVSAAGAALATFPAQTVTNN